MTFYRSCLNRNHSAATMYGKPPSLALNLVLGFNLTLESKKHHHPPVHPSPTIPFINHTYPLQHYYLGGEMVSLDDTQLLRFGEPGADVSPLSCSISNSSIFEFLLVAVYTAMAPSRPIPLFPSFNTLSCELFSKAGCQGHGTNISHVVVLEI